MSAKRQGSTGIKRGKTPCIKVKHYTRSAAQDHITQLKNKGIRGTARLRVIRCIPCAKKEKRDVFHVGHNNGKKGER